MLCEYAEDKNETLSSSGVKHLIWPSLYNRVDTMNKNLIIAKMKFKTSEVDFTVLDARTTLSDKIANLGGTFGIWAEVTGLSILGIINLVLLVIKLLFRICRNGN